MASVYSEIITKPQFIQITCSMLVLSSAFVVARVGLQVWKRKAMELQDYLLYAAYIFFLAMSVCFLVMIPRLFAIAQATAGIIELYPTMMDDVILYFRAMFASTTLFWLTLWSVKLSLLALYKKLMEGLPAMYKKLWWAVFVFCIVVSATCYIRHDPTNAVCRASLGALYPTRHLVPTLENPCVLETAPRLLGLFVARSQACTQPTL
jgi:hypothetical protein